MNLTGRRVLVVGMARSGQAAARLAVRKGATVVTTDLRTDAPVVAGTRTVYGEHRREDFLTADLIVVSPGVPGHQPDLVAAVAAGREVVGELAFSASFLADTILLAVSGTNGKSTTTHLLGQLLTRSGRKSFTGGNLGNPLSEAVDGGYDVAAVEVSSYQMEFPGTFRPRAAAILNLSPDHLERHQTMDNYGAHKCRMFARMGPEDSQILPAADARLNRLAANLPGRRLWLGTTPGIEDRADHFEVQGVGDDGRIDTMGFTLLGAHNRVNLAAATLLALAGGLRRAELDVSGLHGLPHRLEPVHTGKGVSWIDDSKATNVESTLVALASMAGPFVVLLGGQGKAGAAYTRLAHGLRSARGVICFGESGPEIARALEAVGRSVETVVDLPAAVERAAAIAHPGDVVLLSPACASFDAFTDFEHRGRVFRTLAETV